MNRTTLTTRTWVLVLVSLLTVACSSSAADGNGPSAAIACRIQETELVCDDAALLCYAAGSNSTCPNGGLCLGDADGMSCASRCASDDDCRADASVLVCMQGCGKEILNGFCVSSSLRSDLLDTSCTTGNSRGVAGVNH